MDESRSNMHSSQSLTSEKIKLVHQLMSDAYIFNGSYLDKDHTPVEIKWSASQYSPQDIVDMDPQCLPAILCVESGFFGGGNIDCVDSGQVAVVQGIYKQRRVLAIPQRHDDRHFSLPLFGYRHLFLQAGQTSSKRSGAGASVAACSLDALLKRAPLPVTVMFANAALHEHYGELKLVKQYDELYLYGHNMADGNICLPMTVIPVYLDIVFSIGEGVAGGNANDWRLFKDTYIQESQRLLKDVIIKGYLDMASFDVSWQKRDTSEKQKQTKNLPNVAQNNDSDVDSDSSSDSDDDAHYAYVQPSRYIKMGIDLSADDSAELSNDEVVQIEGTDGLLARMLAVSCEVMNSLVKGPGENEPSKMCSRPMEAQPAIDDCSSGGASSVSRNVRPLPPLPPPKPFSKLLSTASSSNLSSAPNTNDGRNLCGPGSTRDADVHKLPGANDACNVPPLPVRRIKTSKSVSDSPSYTQGDPNLMSAKEQSMNQLNRRPCADATTTGSQGKEWAGAVHADKALTLAIDGGPTKSLVKSSTLSAPYGRRLPAQQDASPRYVPGPGNLALCKSLNHSQSSETPSSVSSAAGGRREKEEINSGSDDDDDDTDDAGYVKVDDVELIASMHQKCSVSSATSVSPMSPTASGKPRDASEFGRKRDVVKEVEGAVHPVTRAPSVGSGADNSNSALEKRVLNRPLPCIPKPSMVRSNSNSAEKSHSDSTQDSRQSQKSGRSFSENDSASSVDSTDSLLAVSGRPHFSYGSSQSRCSSLSSGSIPVVNHSNVDSPVNSLGNASFFATLTDVPCGDVSLFSNEQLCQCLRLLGMERCARSFEEDGMIDGQFLMELAAPDLCSHFGFTEFEAKKITLFAKGWRPRKR